MREYKKSKEEDDDEYDAEKYDFACCKHIDESEETRQLYANPGYDVYCTNCDPPCQQPNSYGDFEEVGIYWWRCEKCVWQNGGMFELLCDECLEKRNNPPTCGNCGQKEKDVGELGSYEGTENLCLDCQTQMKEDDDDEAKAGVEASVDDVNAFVEEAREAVEKAKKEGSEEAKKEAIESAKQLEELAPAATEAAEVANKRGLKELAKQAEDAAKKALEVAKATKEAAK